MLGVIKTILGACVITSRNYPTNLCISIHLQMILLAIKMNQEKRKMIQKEMDY